MCRYRSGIVYSLLRTLVTKEGSISSHCFCGESRYEVEARRSRIDCSKVKIYSFDSDRESIRI
jgi:hypothetical protein